MTIAVDMGRKATKTNKQTNKQKIVFLIFQLKQTVWGLKRTVSMLKETTFYTFENPKRIPN